MLPALGPHQQQVRHVGPRHEEDDGHGPEENPQRPTQISNHGFREWAGVRRQTDSVPYFLRHTGHQRKLLDEERNHPCDIAVGLCERHPGFQSSDAVLAEGARACRRSVESQWQDQLRIGIEEREGRRKDADDFARLAIYDQGLPDNVR